MARQRGDLSYVVIFNKRGYSGQVKDLVDSYLVSKSYSWPSTSREYVSEVCGSRPFVRGDCDGSGRVNSEDVYVLARSLTWRRSRPCQAAFDVNGDGRINFLDVAHLANFTNRRGPPPVAPFPRCGVGREPSDDRLGCRSSSARCR